MMRSILLPITIAFALMLTGDAMKIPGLNGPLHASCKVQWSWSDASCEMVADRLLKQIDAWKTADNCPNAQGEKCLYKLVSQKATEIKATHATPKKGYIDDLTFTLSGSGNSCNVSGFSTSETWYAVLDFGTNYCNLHNLITGSALDKVGGYTETTNDNICTQYSTANCDIY